MHDTDQIAALLLIHEKAAAHGTQLEHIKNMALEKLKKINADHAPAPTAQDLIDNEMETEAHSPSLAKALQEKMKGTHHG